MCRLLLVRSHNPVSPADFLIPFAEACRTSTEFQGHGWGITSLTDQPDSPWRVYRNLNPIWEDDPRQFGETRTFLAHARSAFRDEDIVLENNMPFVSGRWSYAFNGELRGVRVRAEGRTGAARIWNLIQRARSSAGLPMHQALEKTVDVLKRQTEYVRAINIFLSDGDTGLLHSSFGESPEYFTLHRMADAAGTTHIASSEPFPLPSHLGNETWVPVPNNTTFAW